ncbi:MAG: hypothetical protein FWG68_03240 [Defluviitaleaceae bacterium]|nr:hypothetical protein [Defluviitaleaceae bacterium]
MQGLKCDVCGGKLVSSTKEDWFLCEHCGTEYPLEWRRAKFQKTQKVKVEGNVEIGNIASVENLLTRAKNFYDADKRRSIARFILSTKPSNSP